MIETKKMYHIEKFTPTECPYCNNSFNNQDKDWIRFLGTIEEGKKVPDPEFPRIICTACYGLPIKINMIGEYSLSDEKEALRICKEEGYFNLMEVEAVGNMAEDHFVNHKNSKPRIVKIP